MEKEKQTVQVAARSVASNLWAGNVEVKGYEIHMGRTTRSGRARPAFRVQTEGGTREDGAVSPDLRAWGTYLHGVFDSDGFRKSFLDGIRKRKGIETSAAGSYDRLKQEGFDKLAAIVRGSIDMKKVYEILQK